MLNSDIASKSAILLFTNKERRKLVDLLFTCPTMSRKESRDMVVVDLRETIKGPMLRDNQNDKLDIRHIVDACLNISSGLEVLIDIIKGYEDDSIPFQALDRFVQKLCVSNIKNKKEEPNYPDYRRPGLLAELELIIGELEVEASEIKQFYDASVPEDLLGTGKWLLREDSDVSLLAQMLERLDDAPVPENGVSPILRFVEQLSLHVKDPQGKLRTWVDTIGRHVWKLTPQEIVTLRQKLQEETSCTPAVSESSPPSMFIKLEPKYGGKQKSFYVKAWLRYGQGEEEIVSLPFSEEALLSEKLYTANTISALLDRLLEDIARFSKVASEVKKNLRIEFFLPYELINLQVDNWRFDDGVARLGIRFPVVIRPLERLYDKKYNQQLWKDKWRNGIPIHTRGEESVYWMSDHAECNGLYLYAHLIKSHVVCLGMTIVPPFIVTPRNKRDKKLLFRTIIKTGTSIVLWPRQLPVDLEKCRDVQKKLRLLLSNRRYLAELPDLVLRQRQDAWGCVPDDGHHLGHHLTLLWDDPTRLLPDVPKLKETRIRE